MFRDVQASTQAMRALQGFDFFGKEMVRGFLICLFLGLRRIIYLTIMGLCDP